MEETVIPFVVLCSLFIKLPMSLQMNYSQHIISSVDIYRVSPKKVYVRKSTNGEQMVTQGCVRIQIGGIFGY